MPDCDCLLPDPDMEMQLTTGFSNPFDLRRGWVLYGGLGIVAATASVVAASTLVVNLTGQPPPREVSLPHRIVKRDQMYLAFKLVHTLAMPFLQCVCHRFSYSNALYAEVSFT